MSPVRLPALLLALVLLASCTTFRDAPPRIGEPLAWSEVPGWEEDRHAEAWPALIRNCRAERLDPAWGAICDSALGLAEPDDETARAWFEEWFEPRHLYAEGGNREGLITGYYEPLLHGSLEREGRYQYPIYREPDDLIVVELGEVYPELAKMRLRGRLEDNRVTPYFTREQIESDRSVLAGNELVWLDDRDDVFFLHIQGSGRIRLTDGRIIGAGYSNQNGHPYVAIGAVLIEREEMELEEVSLFSIRKWLDEHPGQAETLLNHNPSYVFFTIREDFADGPLGSLNVPLTAERSLAIDPGVVGLGAPLWLMTRYPGQPERAYRRLVMAQDTGGAIKGALRADLFWGHGRRAEYYAGVMREPGRLIVLTPRPR